MRITFLCPHLGIAGGVRAVLSYAHRLAARGHEVTVLVPARHALDAWWRNRRERAPSWWPEFGARIRWTRRLVPAELPSGDAVVATAWQTAPVVADAPSRCGTGFYLIQHYESLYHGPQEAVDATYRLPLRRIVISTWLRELLRERFGVEAEVLVTPVDPGLFHRVEAAAATPRPRVLMLHHTYRWKGVADGLEAVARVRARGARLWLVGFGLKPPRPDPGYDEFHAALPQGRLAWLYSSCDVYLCPSWDEGLGMPAMEAMACGAAVVTYDNGGCRDYAHHGVTALVARRRDVADLADQLFRLVTDADLRQRLALAGQQWVTAAFRWERAVERMEALLAGEV